MAKLDEKKKMILVGGVALAISLVAGGATWWAQGLIEEEEQAIAADNAKIAQAEAKIAKIDAAEKEVIILRENLDSYVKILPDERDLNEFVKMLNKFQEQAGITLVEFRPVKAGRNGKNVEQFTKTEYTYSLTASLWQFMRFISFIENYERFVSITNFGIGNQTNNLRGKPTTETDPVHSVQLTMETFQYNGKVSGQDVDIPNYEQKRDALREDIIRRQQNIPIPRYDYRGDNAGQRRDIFDDPRERVNEGGTPGPSLAEQKALIDRYIGELGKLREMLTKARKDNQNIFQQFALEKEVRERITKLEAEIEHVTEQRTISTGLRSQWGKNVVDVLADLKTQLNRKDTNDGPQDPWLQKADLEQLLADMQADLLSGNLEEARTRFESVQEKFGAPLEDPRHALEVQIRATHVKAVTAIAFKALHLDIQGVLVNHEGRSGLLLNGEVLEEGEYVTDELLVKKVHEEQVEFVFRGLTVIRTL